MAESLNRVHRNPKYLTEHTFDERIKAFSGELGDVEIKGKDVLLFAVPTQGLRCVHPICSSIEID